MSNLKMYVLDVTPALAQEWLDNDNNRNRVLNAGAIARYARDMANGDWQFNSEPIIRNDGALLDGQHRLHAVVRSGRTTRFAIHEGVDHAAFTTIDTGVKRGPGASLHIAGANNPTLTAAALNYFHHLTQYGEVRGVNYDASRPTLHRLSEDLGEARIQNALSYGQRMYKYTGVVPALTTALHLYLSFSPSSGGNSVKVDAFFEALITGAGLPVGNPIHELRNYLIGRNFGRGRPGTRQPVAVTVSAWNHLRRGYNVSRLTYSANRPVPKPI